MIYFDYNSRAPLLKIAHQAMLATLEFDGNPSSVHQAGRRLRKLLDEARSSIQYHIDASAHSLTLTSSASEANSQVMHTARSMGAALLISAIEHDSITNAAPDATIIPVDRDGVVQLEALDHLLSKVGSDQPKLISTMAANNETGIIQPLSRLSEIAQRHKALVHVDATQAVGRLPISFNELAIDCMTFSSHKIGGPLGVGALVSRRGIPVESLIHGGTQEQNRRAGTQNIPAIVGFAAALQYMRDFDWQPVADLRDTLDLQIKQICPQVIIHGAQSPRLANTSCLHMPGVDSMTQVMAFDLEGVAVSAGAACSSGKVKPSTVLTAMGCDANQARESIRVSLCPDTSIANIKRFTNVWQTIYKRSQQFSATNNNFAKANQYLARKVAQ